MSFDTTLFKVEVTITDRNRAFWVNKSWVSSDLAPTIRAADILVTPLVEFRLEHEALFPSGTTDFLRALKSELPEQGLVVAIDQDRYEEIALHSKQIRWPTLMLSAVILPLLVNALTEIAKKRLLDEPSKHATIEMSVIVEGHRGHCIEIKYNGPANDLAKTLLEQSDACLQMAERDVKSAKRSPGK